MGKGIQLALIVGWVAVALAATSAQPKPDFSAVREFIKTEMGVGTGTPSMAAAVAHGNEILWEEGFGWVDRPGGTAATKDTLYYTVHDEVLRPLKLENAWAGATPKAQHLVAPRFSALLRDFSPPLAEPTLPGASVLYSSAHELALFGMFHLKARLPAQTPVLSDAGIDRLQDQAVADGNVRHSLAWTINDNQHGYRTLLAQGGTYDSQAWLLLVPSERIVIVVLANYGNVAVGKPIDQILSILLPTYRENLAKAAQPVSSGAPPAAPAVSAAAPEFAGTWSGEIQTHRANVPLRLAITPAGEVEATLGQQAAVGMTNVRVRDNRLTARMPGELGVDYAGGAPYELRFELYRQQNRLIGAAITYAVPGRDGPRLPFWVELKRGGP